MSSRRSVVVIGRGLPGGRPALTSGLGTSSLGAEVTSWIASLPVGGSTYSTPAAVINQSTGLVSVLVGGPDHSLDTY